MKHKISYALLLICSFLSLTSCEKEYNRPEPIEPNLANTEATHTIAQLKGLYKAGGQDIFSNVVIAGVVNSDDTDGNLYRSISIQDETGGIELKMGMGNMNLLYKQGHRVLVKCEGLRLGKSYGLINLGYKSTDTKYETGFVPEKMVPRIMFAGLPAMLKPRVLKISELSHEHAFTLIEIPQVQFAEKELGKTWADPANRQKNGYVERTLKDQDGNSLIVRTSSYARFAGHKLPEGNGSAIGLLSFFNETPQLIVLHSSDFSLNGKRFAE